MCNFVSFRTNGNSECTAFESCDKLTNTGYTIVYKYAGEEDGPIVDPTDLPSPSTETPTPAPTETPTPAPTETDPCEIPKFGVAWDVPESCPGSYNHMKKVLPQFAGGYKKDNGKRCHSSGRPSGTSWGNLGKGITHHGCKVACWKNNIDPG